MSLFKAFYVFVSHLNIFGVFIAFVCKDHDLHITSRMLLDLREPAINADEAFLVCQIAYYDDAVGTLVISICDRSVSLLTGCVPDLEFNR